jgi:UDP-N-acetylmuramate--alanine ligase
MLAELMRFRSAIAIAGTHGKTTTTSMVATLLDAGGLDPTVDQWRHHQRLRHQCPHGRGDWMVVEADESDGTFLKLPADIAVVTNIDPEHLDHYGNFDQVREAFRQFVENVPFYGFGVMCLDHPEVQAMVARIEDRKHHHLWRQPAGRCALLQPPHGRRDVALRASSIRDRARPAPMTATDRRPRAADAGSSTTCPERDGGHRCRASSSAFRTRRSIKRGLSGFGGVKRRFTHTGSWKGVDIFDDYGHHPVEIKPPCSRQRATAAHRSHVIASGPAASLHAACTTSSTISAPASTTPTRSPWSPRSMRPARNADRGRRLATSSWTASRSRGHRDVRAISPILRKISQPLDPRASPRAATIVVCLGAGNDHATGPTRCRGELAAGDRPPHDRRRCAASLDR